MPTATFNVEDVRRVLKFNESTGSSKLYVAHDQGLYIASEQVNPKIGKRECAFARGCDPSKAKRGKDGVLEDMSWWDNARDICGGDDFAEEVKVEKGSGLARLLEPEGIERPKSVKIAFRANTMTISIELDQSAWPVKPENQSACEKLVAPAKTWTIGGVKVPVKTYKPAPRKAVRFLFKLDGKWYASKAEKSAKSAIEILLSAPKRKAVK